MKMGNTVQICESEITIKEYAGKRVVTFKDIDKVHNRPDGTARKRFNDNREYFIKGEDYFSIPYSEFEGKYGADSNLRPFNGRNSNGRGNPNIPVTLIMESGYLMLVKIFRDDLAWKVQRELVNYYFRVKEDRNPVIKRPLTMEDYTEAARTIAKCHKSRLPLVISLYIRAGLDMEVIQKAVIAAGGKPGTKKGAEPESSEVDLIALLNKYSVDDLVGMLNICRTSLYYYRAGRYKSREKRRKYIISILEKNDEGVDRE